jgi:hypothetical protein
MVVVLVVLSLALFSLSGKALADSNDARTLVLSNELGAAQGGLIDRLIATGHGSQNLYQILQLLAAQPGTGAKACIRYCSSWRLSRAAVFRPTL